MRIRKTGFTGLSRHWAYIRRMDRTPIFTPPGLTSAPCFSIHLIPMVQSASNASVFGLPQRKACNEHGVPLARVTTYSADGVHWKKYDEEPSFGKFGPHLGDSTILSYDPDTRSYILTTRHPFMGTVAQNPRLPKTKSFLRPYYPGNFRRWKNDAYTRVRATTLFTGASPS